MSGREGLGALMDQRMQWLRVAAVENEYGTWDVVLRLDGSYAEAGDAEGMLTYWRDQVMAALDADGLDVRRLLRGDWTQ
jgi:hypothetical protein